MRNKSKGLDISQLQKIVDDLNKEYELNPIRLGDTYERVWRVPTGSYEFDWILGGDPILGYGFPIGKHTRLYGESYSGKTLASLNIAKNCQNIHITTKHRLTSLAKLLDEQKYKTESEMVLQKRDDFLARFPEGMIVVYYNIEKQYTKELAQKIGIDTKKLLVSEGTQIEDIGTKMQALLSHVHVHILDSASVAAPRQLLESDFDQNLVGAKARVWGTTWDRVKEHFDIENNSIIQIDQMRTKIDIKPGRPANIRQEPAGGNQVGFAADLSVQFAKGGQLYYDSNNILVDDPAKAKTIDTMSGDREPDGIETVIRIQKSRVCKPFTTARVRIDTEAGAKYDSSYEMFKAAKRFGMVSQAGAWYYLVDDNGVVLDGKDGREKKAWQGKAKFQNACVEDPELSEKIKDKWFMQQNMLDEAIVKMKEDEGAKL